MSFKKDKGAQRIKDLFHNIPELLAPLCCRHWPVLVRFLVSAKDQDRHRQQLITLMTLVGGANSTFC